MKTKEINKKKREKERKRDRLIKRKIQFCFAVFKRFIYPTWCQI